MLIVFVPLIMVERHLALPSKFPLVLVHSKNTGLKTTQWLGEYRTERMLG